jgi:uncharacterized membrane protein
MMRTGLIWSGVCVALTVGAAVWAGQAIPEGAQVPLHWGLDGEADRYGDAAEVVTSLWILAGMSAVLTGVFAFAPMIDPLGANLRRSPTPYLFAWVSALALPAAIAWLIALSGAGVVTAGGSLIPRAIVSAVCVMMIVLGNYLGKVRPNFVLGVRTPWTLTSDIAWEKTHRFAGRLFVLAGVAALVAAWIAPPAVMAMVIGIGFAGCGLVAIAASYVFWRAAPDKRRPVEPA